MNSIDLLDDFDTKALKMIFNLSEAKRHNHICLLLGYATATTFHNNLSSSHDPVTGYQFAVWEHKKWKDWTVKQIEQSNCAISYTIELDTM